MVEEVRRRQGHVDVPGLADRLPVVEALEDGELAGTFLNDPGDPVEVLGPFPAFHLAPHALEGGTGRLHGEVDVLLARFGHLGQRLFGRRVEGDEAAPALRLDELAADEEAVLRCHGDDVARLRCGGVVESHAVSGHQSIVK